MMYLEIANFFGKPVARDAYGVLWLFDGIPKLTKGSLKFDLAKIIYSSDHFLRFLGPDKEFISRMGNRGEANNYNDFWDSVSQLSDYYEMDIPYIDRDGGTVEVSFLQ